MRRFLVRNEICFINKKSSKLKKTLEKSFGLYYNKCRYIYINGRSIYDQ